MEPSGRVIELKPHHMRYVNRELKQRLGAYDRKKLRTYMQQGKADRAERMRAGIMGEAAALLCFGQPLKNLLTRGQLDGGTDLVIGDLTAQVKTAMRPAPKFCYTAEHTPFRADLLIQAAIDGKRQVRLIGWLPGDEYLQLRHEVKLAGWLRFRGVGIEEMHDIRELTADVQDGVPF